MRFSKNSIKVLLLIPFFAPSFVFGYAWERGKGKQYNEYSLAFDPGYKSSFDYNFDCSKLHFNDDTKKLVLTKYKEQGLSDRFTLISKLDIQRIYSDLDIKKEEKSDANSQCNEDIPLNHYKGKMNFIGVDYEIGLRTLLYKKGEHRISVDSILGFPAAINGEGGTNISNPSLKIGLSYANKFDFKKLKENYYEIMFAGRMNPQIKRKEFFMTLNLGLKLTDEICLLFSFEHNQLYKNSFEKYAFASIYKKISTKGLEEEAKEKLKSHIEYHSLLDEKKIENKMGAKISYKLDKKYSLAFDYTYRFAKNIRPYTVKFSIIKNL